VDAKREAAMNTIRSLKNLWLMRLPWVLLGAAVNVLLLYTWSYIVLMDQDLPAVNERGLQAYRSSFLLAPSQRVEGPLTILGPAVSPLNTFFKPIDDCWRGFCGYIDAAAENEPFAAGQLDPERITQITVFLYPPERAWVDQYEDVAKGTRIEVGEGAAKELCQSLSEEPAVRCYQDETPTAGTIRALIDGDMAVFLFFWVYKNGEVWIFHPGSPAQDPAATRRVQNALLPWLGKYVFRKPHRQDEQSGPVGAAMKVDNLA